MTRHAGPATATTPGLVRVLGLIDVAAGLWLLSESHLCCHTFPESGYAAFNLFCCCPRQEWDWAGQLGRELGASHVAVRALRRGGLAVLPSLGAEGPPR